MPGTSARPTAGSAPSRDGLAPSRLAHCSPPHLSAALPPQFHAVPQPDAHGTAAHHSTTQPKSVSDGVIVLAAGKAVKGQKG